jgi:hypothetical protein
MSLMRRGALFAGALFAGVLFGPQAQEAAQQQQSGGRHRPRSQAEYFAPIPWQALDLRRDDEDAFLLATLL